MSGWQTDKGEVMKNKYYDEWKMVCKEFCRQNNATLLFVNDNSFGCEMNGRLLHIYADELCEILKGDTNV